MGNVGYITENTSSKRNAASGNENVRSSFLRDIVKDVHTLSQYQALGSSGHKKKRAGEKESPLACLPRARPVLSFAYYFQAPAMQAKF